MALEDYIHKTGEWLKGSGPHSDIVMSSRIRLARNLIDKPFPNRAKKKDLLDVFAVIEAVIKENDFFKTSEIYKINEIDNVDRQFLVERHLMSHDHATNGEGKAVVVSQEEILS
ncbi:MAG TPA: ATP--guanido phosphotransferase, partial [Candidatus Omnitrophota bacterium]|nr:ATP--guanido phosphotransferase [Candidatus Omnitrophota bacterium]